MTVKEKYKKVVKNFIVFSLDITFLKIMMSTF